MGKFNDLEIEFDGPQRAYFPDQTVCGKVKLQLKVPLSGIKLTATLKGEARVKGLSKVYIDAQSDLWNKTRGIKGNSQATLAVGSHEFDFSFPLPSHLPSSYEDHKEKRIYVRYKIKVTMYRRIKKNLTAAIPFTVLEHIDVNQSRYLQPGKNDGRTMIGRIFKEGPIYLLATIDRIGYCPGENIAVKARIENHSRKRLPEITITLNERRIVDPAGAKRSTSRVVATLVDDINIGPGETDEWKEAKLLAIPVTPPSIMACDLIKLEHTVELKVAGISTLIAVSIPTTFGCVLLRHPVASDETPNVYRKVFPFEGKPTSGLLPSPNSNRTSMHQHQHQKQKLTLSAVTAVVSLLPSWAFRTPVNAAKSIDTNSRKGCIRTGAPLSG
eukprot:m.122976 g.122976  ORF g.122976 m.122976 type:complete len:385 (+) comp37810_c0_seq2:225-1379(+)